MGGGKVALAGEQADDGDVFVEGFPVDAGAREEESGALGGGGVEQAWEPGEGNAEGAAIVEIDPEAVIVEADGGGFRRSGHARHSRQDRLSILTTNRLASR